MDGKLSDMNVSDLIQHNCQDRRTAKLSIRHVGGEALLFFKDGQVVHAGVGEIEGEEAVFQILAWTEGHFRLDAGVEAPATTITRGWSGLLLEGARRLDEAHIEDPLDENQTTNPEINTMAQKIDEILKQLGSEVSGYITSAVVGMDGLSVAEHNKSTKTNPEVISAQMALLFKLVDSSAAKMSAGVVEDNLLTTDKAYLLTRFLPEKNYFLGIAIDRKSGNLGNLRLMSKLYTERITKAMPR